MIISCFSRNHLVENEGTVYAALINTLVANQGYVDIVTRDIADVYMMPCTNGIFSAGLAPVVWPDAWFDPNDVSYAGTYSQYKDGWYVTNGLANANVTWQIPVPAGITYANIQYAGIAFTNRNTSGNNFKPNVQINCTSHYRKFASGATNNVATYTVGLVSDPGNGAPAPTKTGYVTGVSMTVDANSSPLPSSSDPVTSITFSMPGANAGDIDIILHEFNIVTALRTFSYKFSNESVINARNTFALAALYANLFQTTLSSTPAIFETNQALFSKALLDKSDARRNFSSADGSIFSNYVINNSTYTTYLATQNALNDGAGANRDTTIADATTARGYATTARSYATTARGYATTATTLYSNIANDADISLADQAIIDDAYDNATAAATSATTAETAATAAETARDSAIDIYNNHLVPDLALNLSAAVTTDSANIAAQQIIAATQKNTALTASNNALNSRDYALASKNLTNADIVAYHAIQLSS